MPVSFRCQRCRETVSVSRKWVGKRGLCPRCRQPTRVPGDANSDSDVHPVVMTASADEQPLFNTLAAGEPSPDELLEQERQRLELERAKLEFDRAAIDRDRARGEFVDDEDNEPEERAVPRRRARPRPRSVRRSSGLPSWAIALGVLALVGAGGVFVLTRTRSGGESIASLVPSAIRGLEGSYRVVSSLGAAPGQRVIITGRTIEFPGRGADIYEDLGGGRLVITSAAGFGGTVYRWRWDGNRLLLWEASGDERFAIVMAPD